MIFNIEPILENANSAITVDGAGDSAEATWEGVAFEDGDSTRVQFDALASFMDVRLDSPAGTPEPTTKLAVWIVARRGGLLVSDPDTHEPRYPKLHVEVRCFDSGRVIDVGVIDVSSSAWHTKVLPFENDIDPGVDGWDKLAVIVTRLDAEPGNVFVTALELRGLDPGAVRTPATNTRQPQVTGVGGRSPGGGKVVGHAR